MSEKQTKLQQGYFTTAYNKIICGKPPIKIHQMFPDPVAVLFPPEETEIACKSKIIQKKKIIFSTKW